MNPDVISRRTALKQTFCFSAALFAGNRVLGAVEVAKGAANFTMIGDWGKNGDNSMQKAVAKGMEKYLKAGKVVPDGMFLMGDNFYGAFKGGTDCPRWKEQFSDIYRREVFPGPCYAILGNHEYTDDQGAAMRAELAYAGAHPGTRWTMPAKWYRLDLEHEGKPLITVLATDTNFASVKDSLTEEEIKEQCAWLESELAKPRTAPWLVVTGHHPLYSSGEHGDNGRLIKEWDGLFRKHNVDFYFCGHDHDLQHIEIEGHPTSFVVSGGGGAKLRELNKGKYKPFAKAVAGFTHLEVTREEFIVRHVDEEARLMHGFTKSPDGGWRELG